MSALMAQSLRHELAARMARIDQAGLPVVCGRLIEAARRMGEIERTERFLAKLEKLAERKNFGYRRKGRGNEAAAVKYVAVAVALWRAYGDARERLDLLKGGAL